MKPYAIPSFCLLLLAFSCEKSPAPAASGAGAPQAPAAGRAPEPDALDLATPVTDRLAGGAAPQTGLEGWYGSPPQEPANQQGTGGGRRGGTPPPVITKDKSQSRGRVEWSYLQLDLGDMMQQETRPLSFPFTVEGEESVTISEIQTSCGCTNARLTVDGKDWELGTPMAPGTKGEVAATFESKLYSQLKASQITIKGNTLEMPVVLELKAFIHPVFEVRPHMARFENLLELELRRNPDPERTLTVTGFKPFEILKWELPDWVSVEVDGAPQILEDGKQSCNLKVKLSPQIPVGRHSAVARGYTSLDKLIEFQIYAEVSGPARYFPDQIVGFNLVEQGTEPTRKVKIQAAADHITLPRPDFTFEGASAFEVTLDEVEVGKQYALIVQLKPDAEIGRHSGTVHLLWPADSGIQNRDFAVSVLVRKPR